MDLRRAYIALVAVFLVFFWAGVHIAPNTSLAASPVETPSPQLLPAEEQPPQQLTPPPDIEAAIRDAFQAAMQREESIAPAFLIYDVVIDHVQYSQDGSTALIWLAAKDPETGEIVASEPGLSIARNPNPGASAVASNWAIVLPPESVTIEQVQALPEDLLTPDVRSRFLESASAISAASAQVFSGYKLPWTAGQEKRMTNSIGHVYTVSGGLTSCPNTCRYAFDFADGTMFPMLAAKGGTVKALKISCANGDSNCTNYLTLEDQSTIPTSYQLYYHLANNSIPSRLRVIGATVRQGEYIGDADDTGASTGHHLHFHVFTSATQSGWSWGASQDITFDDVSDNGGRPRTCAEASQYPNMGSECNTGNRYMSGNTPANPPSARLDLPANRAIITSRNLHLQGVATDDIQITRIQVLANYDGAWNTIDDVPPVSGTFSRDVDLCSAGIPDGPFALTVRVYDREGSLAPNMPVRQLVKSFACGGIAEPPPATSCTPASNQIALYTQPDFRGDCVKFTAGTNYTSGMLGLVGNDRAASVQVGSSVRAVLYDRSEDVTANRPGGRIETLESSDANLSDNPIGVGRVSGLRVLTRTTAPGGPLFNSPVGNRTTAGVNPTSIDSLVLAWEGAAGATLYDVSLTSPVYNRSETVTGSKSLSVGTLPAGAYRLSVTGRNSAGTNLTEQTFTVDSGSLTPGTKQNVPYEDTAENGSNGWTATGLWQQAVMDGDVAWVSNRDGIDYDDAVWRAGDLTSPVILLPAGQVQYLRFEYFMNTEDGNPYWDQRRVQISANGGRFVDLFQLSDDRQEPQIWLNSGPISLADYAGQEIRLRFHFDVIDEDYNNGSGWAVDNVTVNANAPDMSCVDGDDSAATAQTISIGIVGLGMICPERDVDYYKFTANAGQPVIVDIDAKMLTPSSALDPMVFLLDGDGRSVINYNDDEQLGVYQDSWLTYTVGRAGTYYLKIKPWDYPGAGSRAHVYQLSLRDDTPVAPRDVHFTYPRDRSFVPAGQFDITVSATDFDGGPVSRVDFYWHGPDWNQTWTWLGSDTDGGNGWSQTVNPATYGGVTGSAVVALARGRTGGYAAAALWDLLPDYSTPVTALSALPEVTNSTVIPVRWTASDSQNDIIAFDLQFQVNSGSGWSAWQNWSSGALPGSARSAWFAGTPGSSYRFQVRARDQAGNVEQFPSAIEAATTLAATCTPDDRENQGQTIQSPIVLATGVSSGSFNLCRSAQQGAGGDDVDWFSFNAQQGQELLLMTMSEGGSAAFSVSLYKNANTDEASRVATWVSPNYGTSVAPRWVAPETRTYYLSVRPLRAEMSGTDMRYQLWVGEGNWTWLPVIGR